MCLFLTNLNINLIPDLGELFSPQRAGGEGPNTEGILREKQQSTSHRLRQTGDGEEGIVIYHLCEIASGESSAHIILQLYDNIIVFLAKRLNKIKFLTNVVYSI